MNTKSAVLCFALALGLTTMASAQVINEFVANHTGTDTNEFVEVFGSANTDLSAYTVIQIEGDGAGAGTIDTVLGVGTTDGNGFWVSSFFNNEFENNTQSLLMVLNFTGSDGSDLDTDNDGILDLTPWDSVADCVAVRDNDAADQNYCGVILMTNFDGNPNIVGGASRIPNGTDTDSVSDWMRNDFEGDGLPGFDGNLDPGEALNTPGTENMVPEPGTMILLGLGALAALRRSRR